MQESGVDLAAASRQEMRSYVCAQCHGEYYLKGPNKALTFPWSKGRTTAQDRRVAHPEPTGAAFSNGLYCCSKAGRS